MTRYEYFFNVHQISTSFSGAHGFWTSLWLVDGKIKIIVFVCFYEITFWFWKPFSNPLHRTYSGYFTLRQWECKQEAALDTENCSGSRLWYCNGENRPIAENQSRKSTNGKEEELDRNLKILNGICLLHDPLYSLHMHLKGVYSEKLGFESANVDLLIRGLEPCRSMLFSFLNLQFSCKKVISFFAQYSKILMGFLDSQ